MNFGQRKAGTVIQMTINGRPEAIIARPHERRRPEQEDLFARKARPWLIKGDLSRFAGREAVVAEPVETQAEMF